MKASELRIGNFVMDRGGKVLLIDHWEYENKISEKRVDGLQPFTEFVEYLQPIPLTEEWLLKFGFKKLFTLAHQDSCYRIDLFRIDLFGEYFDLWHDNHPIISIEYVHQLQNLYFALTNKELTYEQQK